MTLETKETKKDWSLWLAIALPIAMIVFVAGSIYLPRLWAPQPQYDFLYTVRDWQTGQYQYTPRVENGVLTKDIAQSRSETESAFAPSKSSDSTVIVEPRLFVYHTKTGESERMSFESAEQLRLDDRFISPDGFQVKKSEGYGGVFSGGSENALFLSGHLTSHKLNVRGVENVFDFEFIGWVIE